MSGDDCGFQYLCFRFADKPADSDVAKKTGTWDTSARREVSCLSVNLCELPVTSKSPRFVL